MTSHKSLLKMGFKRSYWCIDIKSTRMNKTDNTEVKPK